uniref:Uncharacterized protein n=1 Tax=Parascaris univalens TaxID=6257 RepID=A0A914ZSZ9_PARUN
MGDALRCSLDERFFVTIEFDDKYDAQEGRHLICARLQCCEHEEDILAEKKFLWPEMKLPNEAKYLEEDGVLKLFGEDNIAKIALNMDRMLLARLNSTKLRAEVCPVYTSVMKNRQLLTSEPITITVMNIINGEDVERSWSELVELMSPSRNTKIPAELLYSTFAPWRQKALLDCISSRLGKDGSGKAVLTGFVQQRVFRATDVSLRIAKLVQCEGWFDIALDFIRCALSIDEAVYAVYLKMAHDSIEDSGTELLSALLNHTITHRNLVEQVADKLSGREAAALIDRLVALIDMQELDVDRYRNILELLAVLVDGCAQRMLWDGKCHDAIRRAANCITEEVHLADTISKFGYHSHDSVPHPDPRSDLQYSDYVIESVSYQCKSL